MMKFGARAFNRNFKCLELLLLSASFPVVPIFHSTPANHGYQEIPVPENEKLEEATAKVQCLSFKSLSGEGVSKRKTGPPQPQLKGLPQQKALRKGTISDKTNGVQESYSSVDVPDLDSEENPLNVKFLSFKIPLRGLSL